LAHAIRAIRPVTTNRTTRGQTAMLRIASFFLITAAALADSRPPHWKKAVTARWMAQTLDWGFLSTISTRSEASKPGDAFGNPYSFADASTGVPYFYASDLDASMIDVFTAKTAKPRASLVLSEATITDPNWLLRQYCAKGTFIGDPENPPCARLVLSGKMVRLAANSTEEKTARAALFLRHPSFANYPAGHDFFVAKMEVDGVWLIDFYGGAGIIPPAEYFGATLPSVEKQAAKAPKASVFAAPPPAYQKLAATARWMAKTLIWGSLSTISTRSQASTVGDAFGNPNSFADVSGVPYFYVADMDASMIDVFTAKTANPRVSLALSEAELTGTEAVRPDCVIGSTSFSDPENPPCARLVLSGKMVRLAVNSTEEKTGRAALFERHPSFAKYPSDHSFFVAKLEVDGVWLIDFYGGAAIIPPAEYFAANPIAAAPIVV